MLTVTTPLSDATGSAKPKAGTQVAILVTPGQFWESLLDDCRKATHSIHFDQYILGRDAAGEKLIQIFSDKAAEGVKVNLLLDRVGSRKIYGSKLINAFRQAGGKVVFYNNLQLFHLFTPKRWFPRNHVKTTIIDGKVAYVGSACCEQDMQDWRDITLRIAGNFTDNIETHFRHSAKGPVNFDIDLLKDEKLYRYIVTRTGPRRNPIYRELLWRIENASQSIRIVSPYFLPPIRLRRALKRAVERGVQVQVILGGRTDVRLADWVSSSFFGLLLRYGVEMFAYQPTIMHAKYMLIDNEWASVGSCNIDYLSLFRNREANIFTADLSLVDRLNAQFDDDRTDCIKIDKDYCQRLPLWQKVIGYMGRCMKKFL